MRIVFITGCLEPGRDGVGDYTRRLAAECIRQGHASIILALNDPHIVPEVLETQTSEGVSISVLRLPERMPWKKRVASARKWLDVFNPDWVSLQFVPFGFHPKGLPLGLARNLKFIIGSRPLHWMFHELWVLWEFPLPLRKRLLGQVQKFSLRISLIQLKPKVVTTHLPVYKGELRKFGLAVELFPLHGNIPVRPPQDAYQWLKVRYSLQQTEKSLKAGFFGNILPTLDPHLVGDWISRVKAPGQKVVILSAGKSGAESKNLWNSLANEFANMATFLELGELDERDSSFYFSALDYGLTAYPPELMGKSGSVAAMREHGLAVIPCGSMSNDAGTRPRDASGIASVQPWSVKQSAHALLQQLQVDRF